MDLGKARGGETEETMLDTAEFYSRKIKARKSLDGLKFEGDGR